MSSKAKAMEQVNSRAYNFRKYERYKMSTHRLTPEINYHEFSILFASQKVLFYSICVSVSDEGDVPLPVGTTSV